MPLYDRTCTACDWQAMDVWEAVTPMTNHDTRGKFCTPYPKTIRCPQCNAATVRAWLRKPPAVVGDECDFIAHNGAKEPFRVRSKAEYRRFLKANGFRIKDTHVPAQGSDKSKFTRSWATLDPYTAANVKLLLERAFGQAEDPPDEEGLVHVQMSEGIAKMENGKLVATITNQEGRRAVR